MENKVCSKCKEEKQIINFNKRKDRKSGFSSWCKLCIKKKNAKPKREKNSLVKKICSKCKEEKPLNDFYKRNGRSTYGFGTVSQCKECLEKNRKRYPNETPTHQKWVEDQVSKDPNWYRRKNLKRFYNITLEQFDDMLKNQNGVCAICKGPPMGKGSYHVDHYHKTGKIRGLLCHKCNIALGMVQDKIDHLEALITYLNKFSNNKGEK